MSYKVTALKWRPQRFDELVGQEHISTTIKNAILNNRIAHAYIFAGPRGVGKTTTARIFAKILNCLNPKDGEPCNNCEMCNSFNSSQSLDVIEIDGASNRRIEEIRTLRESVKYAPTKGAYKVYIIDEVHMLTTESFNALLKTLEEPPDRTIFIFATTDVHKVPLTIISRCQRYDFRRIELQAIINTLRKISDSENIKIDDPSLTIIAKKADGALRDAQSLFDQVIAFCGTDIVADEVSKMLNLINEDIYFEVTEAIGSKNFAKAFTISKSIYENGWNFIDFLNGLLEHFRNIMTVIVTKESKLIESTENYRKKYLQYTDEFSEGDILRILSYLSKIQNEIRNSQNQKLKVEVALCHIIGLEKSTSITELINNLGSVETSSKKKVVEEKTAEIPVSGQSNAPLKPLKSNDNYIQEGTSYFSEELESISKSWLNFIELINSEKFTLGSHLRNSKPLKIVDNTVTVELATKEDIDIIKDNRNYLGCMIDNSNQIFSKKLNFDFIVADDISVLSALSTTVSEPDKKSDIGNVDANLSEEESSLIDAIVNQLGGREINR